MHLMRWLLRQPSSQQQRSHSTCVVSVIAGVHIFLLALHVLPLVPGYLAYSGNDTV
jgi:hypothetical protein